MLAAVVELANEASTLIIYTGYTLSTPLGHVTVAADAGLLKNPGTVSAQNTRGLLLEFPMVSGMGGVGVATGRQAGATASTVRLQWV